VSLKCGNLEIVMSRSFADCVFRLMRNSTHNSLQAYVSSRRYTAASEYTYNMMAVTIADRMTSLPPHVFSVFFVFQFAVVA